MFVPRTMDSLTEQLKKSQAGRGLKGTKEIHGDANANERDIIFLLVDGEQAGIFRHFREPPL